MLSKKSSHCTKIYTSHHVQKLCQYRDMICDLPSSNDLHLHIFVVNPHVINLYDLEVPTNGKIIRKAVSHSHFGGSVCTLSMKFKIKKIFCMTVITTNNGHLIFLLHYLIISLPTYLFCITHKQSWVKPDFFLI
jgi:hypothetical protein